jgi:hypothetical protein
LHFDEIPHQKKDGDSSVKAPYLTKHRANSSHLKEEPLNGFPLEARIMRQELSSFLS